jgi:hypothetical protein
MVSGAVPLWVCRGRGDLVGQLLRRVDIVGRRGGVVCGLRRVGPVDRGLIGGGAGGGSVGEVPFVGDLAVRVLASLGLVPGGQPFLGRDEVGGVVAVDAADGEFDPRSLGPVAGDGGVGEGLVASRRDLLELVAQAGQPLGVGPRLVGVGADPVARRGIILDGGPGGPQRRIGGALVGGLAGGRQLVVDIRR